jgi:anti-sigma B factor antagonist
MDIEVRSQGQVKIVKLRGRLSLGEPVDRLRATMEFLTATKQQGGSLKLVNPSKFVVQTLKLVGLLNLFEVFSDTPAAVASFV